MSWLLEGMVFLVVGLQLRRVLAGIGGMAPSAVAVVTLAVVGALIVVRFAWVVAAEQGLATVLHRRHASWTETTLTAWSGMRGAVSLAAVLTLPVVLPDGRPFPQRDLIVFITFVVILATLLGQQLGWRSTYWAVTVIGVLALGAVARAVPETPLQEGAGARQELGALHRPQVWLTLLVGAAGFGGFFGRQPKRRSGDWVGDIIIAVDGATTAGV